MDGHRVKGHQAADVSTTHIEGYEPPLLTELGSFHDVTAGLSRTGPCDHDGRSPYR